MTNKSHLFKSFFGQGSAFAAALLTLLLNSFPASATDIAVAGDRGDKSFHTVCQPGNFMVGLDVHSGAWVNQISIKCASIGKDGSTGNPVTMEPHGGPGGGEQSGTNTCAAGAAISGMHVSFTPNEKQVRFFIIDCHLEKDGSITSFKIGASAETSAPLDQVCAPDELAIGLNGNEGKDVNAVGLICAANPKNVTTPQNQAFEQYCKTYAANAVADYNKYVSINCNNLATSDRWSNNYQGHYNWCISLGASSHAPAKEEADRQGLLSRCSTTNPAPNGALQNPVFKFCVADCSVCTKDSLTCSSTDIHCSAITAPHACYGK